MRRTLLLAIFATLATAGAAQAQYIARDILDTRSMHPRPVVKSRRIPAKTWKIPAGRFGVQVADGTRIIGKPAAGWQATLKTGFGTVNIPLDQIGRIETSNTLGVSIYLKSGDRVSGKLLSAAIPFETRFGALRIPATDLRLLSSDDVVLEQARTVTVRAATPVYSDLERWKMSSPRRVPDALLPADR